MSALPTGYAATNAEIEAEIRLIAENIGARGRWRLRYLALDDRDDVLSDGLRRFFEARRRGDQRPREVLFDTCLNGARQKANNDENRQTFGPSRERRRQEKRRGRAALKIAADAQASADPKRVIEAERELQQIHSTWPRRVALEKLAKGSSDPSRAAEEAQFNNGLKLLMREGRRLLKKGLTRHQVAEQLGLYVGFVEAAAHEVSDCVTGLPANPDNLEYVYEAEIGGSPPRLKHKPCPPCLDCLWFDGITKLPAHRVDPEVVKAKMQIALEVKKERGDLELAAVRRDSETNCDEMRRSREVRRRRRYNRRLTEAA